MGGYGQGAGGGVFIEDYGGEIGAGGVESACASCMKMVVVILDENGCLYKEKRSEFSVSSMMLQI